MANKQLQLRRGTATATDSFTGAEGEITYVTDTKTVRVHDGTAGGTELLKADMANVSAGGTTVTIDAKVQLSHADYATVDGDDDLTLATKGWVSNQGSGGGLVGAQNNIGDTSITSATLGDFLVYQGASAASSAKWVNKTISGDVDVDENGTSVIQANAVETDMIADANVTNAKLAHPNVAVTDGTTAHTLSLGNTLTFSATANETTVVQNAGTVTIGLVDAPQLGNVTASTLSVTNDLTVGGNLTVSGTTTTVNTETINLADNIITLNSNETGAASQNAGIEVERGTDTNVALRWNESDSGAGSHKWQVTEDGSTYYDIVHVGDTGTVSGAMIAGDAIDESKIADAAIDSEHYVNGSIDNVHIADDTITSAKLADFTDTLAKDNGYIVAANGSTLTSLEPAGDIGTSVTGSTITFSITAGAIVDADINASAAISGSKLAAGSVTATQLNSTNDSDKVQTANIANSAIQAAQIAAQAVTPAKLHADVAGTGLSGGNNVALAVDLSELPAATIANATDSIVFIDADDSNASRKESVVDFVDAFSGSHMTAENGVLAIDNFTGVTAGSITASKAVLVDESSDVSGFGTVGATTFSGTLSGQVSTAEQNSITSIPSLGTVGDLDSGSITSNFGSINVGLSAITGGTITASNKFVGDVTGDITGNVAGDLDGQVTAATQSSITSIPGLVTVGDLGTGSITTGFGSIDVGNSAISGGTITGIRITDGAAYLQGGALTANSVTDGTATLASGTLSGLTKAVVDQLTIDNTSITQAGTLSDLTISASGTVNIESVNFDGGAVTGVTSLTAVTVAGTLSTAAQPNITSVGTLTSLDVDKLSLDEHIISSSTIMQISAGASKAVTIESVSINDGAVTGISTLTTNGNVTLGGDIAVNGGDITSTAPALNISAASSVNVESVNFADGVISNATSLAASNQVSAGSVTDGTATLAAGTLSGATKIVVDELTIDDTSITQAGSEGAKNLTVSASNGNVLVEDVTFNGSTVTGIGNLTADHVITANTFVGAFNGEVSSDVLAASTLTVSTRFTLDAGTEFYIGADEVTATAAEINRLASIDTSNDTSGKLAVVNSDGYIHGSFKSLSSQGGTGVLLQNVLFDVRDINGDTVFKIDPVSSDETIVKTARLAVDDSLLQVNANTSASVTDNQHDIGIFGNLGAGKAAAVVYDRSDAAWKLVDDVNVPENAINTIAPTDAQLADLEVKGIRTAAGVQRAVATADGTVSTLSASNHVWFQDGDTYTTLNLPTASGNIGREFIVRNTGSSTAITVSVQSGDELNGTTDGTVDISAGASAKFIAEDGNSWWTI
jgi:hypothetical protein